MLRCSFHACLHNVQLTYRVCALQFTHELCSIGLKTREKYRPILGVLRNHLETQMCHAIQLDRRQTSQESFERSMKYLYLEDGLEDASELFLLVFKAVIKFQLNVEAQSWIDLLERFFKCAKSVL